MAPQVVQYPRATSSTAHSSHATGVEGAGGRKRAWPRCRWAAAGPGRTTSRRAEPRISDQAPPVWRAPEGPEGTGGLRDRPLRAAGSRVAISRAAGPDGTRNTSGTTSETISQVAHRPRAHQAARPSKAHHAGSQARRRPEHQQHPAARTHAPTHHPGITKPPGPIGAGRQWR